MTFRDTEVELIVSRYIEPANIALILNSNGTPYAVLTRNICKLPYTEGEHSWHRKQSDT